MYTFGINDEEFIRGKVPMTKAEVRAMIMVKARIAPEDTVVDRSEEHTSELQSQR